jgi:hypothetical protein
MKGRAVRKRKRWKELGKTGTRRQEAAKKKLDLSTLRLRVRKKNWKNLQADEEEDRKREDLSTFPLALNGLAGCISW